MEAATGNARPWGQCQTDGSGACGFSLVIPVWNEQETIGQTIQEATAALCGLTVPYEIIIVDDGSTDRTAEVVRARLEGNFRVELLQHPRRLGYWAALRTGARAATGELIAFTDSACPFDFNDLESLLPFTWRNDITRGYRMDWDGPVHQRCFSWAYNNLVTLLTGSEVRDPASALTIIRREQLASVLPETDDTFASAEMFVKARLNGITVAEIGVQRRGNPPRATRTSWLAVPKALPTLLRFWWSRLLFPADDFSAATLGGWFWAGLLLVALVAGALLFCNLSYPLLEPDEGRYAEIAREMLRSGDWIVPTLNRQPFYDKPPLFYWLVAASFRLFGTNEWAARLVPTLAAFWTVLATYVFGRRIVGLRSAFLAALVLTLTVGFIQVARIVILDSLLTLFVTGALFTAYEAVRGPRLRGHWWIASALCCALGVLTKGPIAFVLLAPPLAAYVWLNRDRPRLTLAHWGAYIGLVLGLALPWYGAITIRDPNFAYYFFVDQHLIRFWTHEYHVQPMWYYVPVLLIGCLPWSLLLVPIGRFLLCRSTESRALRPRAMGFFLLWASWCILFFSASSSKLPPYILPALPALALLVGGYLDHLLFHPSLAGLFQWARRAAPRQAIVLLSAAGLVASIGAWRMQLISQAGALVQAGLFTACTAGVNLWGRKLPPKAAWLLCSLLAAVTILETAHKLVPAWSHRRSPMTRYGEIAELVRDEQLPVACYAAEWGSIPFYLGRDDLVINEPGVPAEELQKRLSVYPRYVIVLRHKAELERFRRVMTPGIEITKVLEADEIGVAFVRANAIQNQTPTLRKGD
jgi:dolichol-phosphate mannosyltransferase